MAVLLCSNEHQTNRLCHSVWLLMDYIKYEHIHFSLANVDGTDKVKLILI